MAKKVAANKAQYDKAARDGTMSLEPGDRVMIRIGSFSQRMHGRLQRRYKGPYLVSQVKGKVVTYKGDKGQATKANVDAVKKFRERPSC